MPKLLYNFASRSRPSKLIACIENILSLSMHYDWEMIITLDVDDTTVSTKSFNDKLLSLDKRIRPVYGFSKSKVDAINKNVWMCQGWDILLNHSDDMMFLEKGFDLDIIGEFYDFTGLVHFPDQRVNEKLCTYSIMHRKYYDQFGYIYHPDYRNLFCDNEQTCVAKMLGKYKYVDKKILEHQHYRAGYGAPDELMLKTDSWEAYEYDSAVFQKRAAINFGI